MAALGLSKLHHSVILCRFTRNLVNICHGQKKSICQTSIQLTSKKPVKPIPPFFEYSHKTYQDERSRYPEYSHKEILNIIGEKFRSLDAEELEDMRADYRSRMDEYNAKLQEWKDSLTVEEREQMEAARKRKMAMRKMKRMGKAKDDLDKPKRPKSAYLLFFTDYKVKNRDASPTDQMKERAEAWKALSTAKKQVYEEKSMKLRMIYQEEMEEWEQEKIANEEFSKLRSSTKRSLKK